MKAPLVAAACMGARRLAAAEAGGSLRGQGAAASACVCDCWIVKLDLGQPAAAATSMLLQGR